MRTGIIYRCFTYILISFIFISTIDLWAAQTTSEDALKELERRQFETEKKLREKERIELEQRKKEREEKGITPIEDDTKFMINKINLLNDELLSGREKRKLLEPYLNKEISYNDITILVRSITNILIDKGYITARVKVPLDQNLKSGELSLVIVNGYISELVPEKDSLRNRMQIFTAFPFLKSEFLNIEDLDYGIEQMNRLQSNNAAMKIFPGEELGASKVVIFNDPGSILGLDIGYDNLGNKATGENRGRLSANLDNLFSINDNFYFDYTGTTADQDEKYSRSHTMFLSLPFGYWTFSSTYNRSEYMQYIEGLNTVFKSSGNDTSKVFAVDKMLGRKNYHRFKAKTTLTLKDKEDFIEDAKIEVSSRKLSIMKLGLDYSTYLLGGYFSTVANYHKGLDILDAKKDASGLSEDAPRAQFDKYEGSVVWNIPFMLLGQSFGYLFNASGQYSKDTLYSSEKLTIGDMYTVRGFKNDSVTGDKGYYIRNDLSIYDFSRLWNYLKGFKYFAGYDYGHVAEKAGKHANYGEGKGTLCGWSTGIAYSSEILNMNLTYSRQISSPRFVEEKEHIIYCTVTVSLSGIAEESWKLAFKNKNEDM